MVLSKLLDKLFGRAGDEGERVYLAAFGKHPGWDDHIEDIGLESEPLVAVKRWLYVQGVAGNIDSGGWDELDGDHRLDGFRHAFLSQRGGDVIAGRLWSSRDGKGRTQYPMVVCAHCRGLPMLWVWMHIIPALEEIEQGCTATQSAQDVVAILAEHRRRLRELAEWVQWADPVADLAGGALAKLADRPEMGPAQQGLFRVLYQLQRELLPRLHDADGTNNSAGLLRVPACRQSPDPPGQIWLSFLLAQLGPAVGVVEIMPLDQPWVDLIIGEPTRAELTCLRAATKVIPLATEVPYTLGETFLQQARRRIEASRAGGDERLADLPAFAAGRPSAPRPSRWGRLLRWRRAKGLLLPAGALLAAAAWGLAVTP